MALISADQFRGITRNITINKADGTTLTPGANDKVRAIICRLSELGGTADNPTGAKLIVTSGADTDNGSSFTKGAINVLRLDAQDLTFGPGVFTLLVDYFDNADEGEWKHVSTQVFVLGET